MIDKAFIVWSFYDAPEELRCLSNSGGDEDWLVEIPPDYKNEYVRWLNHIDSLDPQLIDHPIKKGWQIAIGGH